jgi:indolepyruvate ferredoxin oxidoreductase
LAKRDKRTGHLKKKAFGPRMMMGFRLLAGMRFLRNTILDPFARTGERKFERELLRDYEATLDLIEAKLSPDNIDIATALAAYPRKIRGFGHVKEAQARPALAERKRLTEALLQPGQAVLSEAAE